MGDHCDGHDVGDVEGTNLALSKVKKLAQMMDYRGVVLGLLTDKMKESLGLDEGFGDGHAVVV